MVGAARDKLNSLRKIRYDNISSNDIRLGQCLGQRTSNHEMTSTELCNVALTMTLIANVNLCYQLLVAQGWV